MSDLDLGGNTSSTDTNITTTAPPPPPSSDGKVMTQTQIDSIVGRAETKAAAQAKAAVLEELGMGVADARKAIEEANAAADARLTNEQRLERKLAESEANSAKVSQEAKDALKQARITTALAPHMEMGAIRRIASTIHVPDEATDEDLDQIVEDLRLEIPGLFTSPTLPTPPGTTSQNRQRPASRQTSATSSQASKEWVDQYMETNTDGGELPLL